VSRARPVAALALGALLCTSGAARAQPDGGARRTVVVVLPEGAGGDLELAIRAQLADVDVDLAIERVQMGVMLREHLARARELVTAHGAAALVWADVAPEGGEAAEAGAGEAGEGAGRETLLYLFDRDGARTMVRRLEAGASGEAPGALGEDGAAAREEELALVVRSMVAAVVEGGVIDVRPPPAAPPPPPPPPPPPAEPSGAREENRERRPDRPPFIEVSAGYAGQLLHESAPWQNGLRTTVAWLSPGGRFTLGMAYVFWAPTTLGPAESRLRVSRHAFEVIGSFGVPLRVLRLGGELALLGEWNRRETVHIQGTPSGPGDTFVLGVGLRIRLDVRLWRALCLTAVVGVDGLLRRVRYVVDVAPEGEDLVLDPLLIRPFLSLGLAGRFG